MTDNPFINDISVPKTVFKFRDWTNQFHKNLLNGEMYLSSPLDFNDPFDCNIGVGYNKLQNNPELQQEYFTLVVDRQKPDISPEQKKIEVNRLINEGRFNDPVWLKWQAETTRQSYGKNLGVFCMTKTKDNILLWSHYANSHRGFCVGFNSEQLFFECLKLGMKGGDVAYNNAYPDIDLMTDLLTLSIQQTYIKSDMWSYEQEYRLSKIYSAKKTFNFSKQCFKEIYLGCEITKEHRQEIIDFVKNNIPGLPIHQAVTVPNRFELSFEQIE